MLAYEFFQLALPYDAFLERFGSPSDRSRWDSVRQDVVLTADQQSLLAKFTRQMNVLVLSGAWCGDCANQCPIFECFQQAAPLIQVRYLDRDAHPDAQLELQINAGNRVPVVVFFSEDGHEVGRYGERTLTAYRRMAQRLIPGLAAPDGDYFAHVVADWLREFERAQWLLRLSGRLRNLHQD